MQALISFYLIAGITMASVAMYMLPALVAWQRHAPDFAAVIVVNLALGWTFIGWIIALAMAMRRPLPPPIQVIGQLNAPGAAHPEEYWDPQRLP